MAKKLYIIGASGHGKVIADIAIKFNTYDEIAFLDDNQDIKDCMGFPVIGSCESAFKLSDGELIVAIGNSTTRLKMQKKLEQAGMKIATLIHPSAVIGTEVQIEEGTVIMAGAVINSGSYIGKGVIINTSSSIDHDNVIGDFCHISVGAHLAGNVTVGAGSWIGIGSSVIQNIQICSACVIGAGAIVIKDITESGTYVGVPARRV